MATEALHCEVKTAVHQTVRMVLMAVGKRRLAGEVATCE